MVSKLLPILLFCWAAFGDAFVAPSPSLSSTMASGSVRVSTPSPLNLMMDPTESSAVLQDVLTMQFAASSMNLAETQAWVQPLAGFLDPFLNFMSFGMLARVVLSWYPETKISKMPWLLVALPTEPLLRSVKGVVPPAFGVDITPVVWLGLFTFIHEILLGQQGLLTMKIKYGI
mmetsp:Transcript_2747/g.7694  ORF Transcript_2747/g.7694 Transcript_2747/m.7694 type:complete len:174 (+) Transcript_2747:60-581(+)